MKEQAEIKSKPKLKATVKTQTKARAKTKAAKHKPILLHTVVMTALENHKAIDAMIFDVREMTTVTDYMIVCSGTSTRHVKALSEYVVAAAKAHNKPPLGVEGARECEWILVDLIDVVVHIMLPQTREFYSLEKLWDA
jgi:ribosome-associated protein